MRYLVNATEVIGLQLFRDDKGSTHEVSIMPRSRLKIKDPSWEPLSLERGLSMIDDTPVAASLVSTTTADKKKGD